MTPFRYQVSVTFIEAASLILFLLGLRALARVRKQAAAELFFAFVYGLILEELDIYFFRTYRYGPGFMLQLGQAPLAIAFLWSLILSSSMALSDRLRMPEFCRPFLDGLLALLIDIGVDAIAIRIGYWSWTIPLSEGWFGVPAGNLYSWMWVAFAYSSATRVVRRLGRDDPGRHAYQALAPFVSYLVLFAVIVAVGVLSLRCGVKDESQRLWIFYGHVFLFSIIAGSGLFRSRRQAIFQGPVPGVLILSRLSIHVYFLGLMFLTGMAWQIPLLAAVTLSALALEVAVDRLACFRKKLEL